MTISYRRDIDGLRALAVVPVVFFHAGFAPFEAGYIGVDIFFVISGYLITTIILKELEAGTFTIVNFYERRARRIFPALFVMTLTCIPFAWLWMYPAQFESFLHSVIAVPLFLSNFLFWQEAGYFDAAAEAKPLLHTWTLAVEEQFYVVFPLFMLFCWGLGKRKLTVIIAVTALASLVLAEQWSRHHPDANFYLPFTRAWELAAGSLTAFALHRRERVGSPLLSLLGLILILSSFVIFDEHTRWPSLYALVPVLGTVLIIAYGTQGSLTYKLLANRMFVGIGLISYSIYLWHQPLFAFARIINIHEPSVALMTTLSLVSFVLGWASWKLIEEPFRDRRRVLASKPALFSASAGVGVMLIAISLVADNSRHYENNLLPEAQAFVPYFQYTESPDHQRQFRAPRCFAGSAHDSFDYFDKDYCLGIAEDRDNYIVLGDSQAAHLWLAISESYPDVNVMQATASGCRPLLDARGAGRCTELMSYVFDDFITANKIDGIILSARWQSGDLKDLKKTVEYLQEHVAAITVVGPTVEYSNSLPQILISAAASDLADSSYDEAASSYVIAERKELSKEMHAALAESDANFVSIVSALCSERRCRTLSESGGPMAFDYGHLTLSGARTVVQILSSSGNAIIPEK